MFNFSEKKKESKEPFVLELIVSIMETKRPKKTIEDVIALTSKKGESKLTTELYEVLAYIEEGRSYIESFYYAEMLTDETFSIFKLADEKNALNREMIEERIENKESMDKIDSSIKSSMMQPFLLIFAGVAANIFIVSQIMPVLRSFYSDKHQELPMVLAPFDFAEQHPFFGFLGLLSILYFIMGFLIYIVKNKTGASEMMVYKISAIIKILKDIGLSYEQIFLQLYESESNRKLKVLYYTIYTSISVNSVLEAMEPIVQKLPIGTAVVLFDRISRNDDVKAWSYTKERMKEETFSKIEKLSKVLPFLGYMMIFMVILIAMVPIGFLVQQALALT